MIVLACTSITSELYIVITAISGLVDLSCHGNTETYGNRPTDVVHHQLQLPYFLAECSAFLNATYWNVHALHINLMEC